MLTPHLRKYEERFLLASFVLPEAHPESPSTTPASVSFIGAEKWVQLHPGLAVHQGFLPTRAPGRGGSGGLHQMQVDHVCLSLGAVARRQTPEQVPAPGSQVVRDAFHEPRMHTSRKESGAGENIDTGCGRRGSRLVTILVVISSKVTESLGASFNGLCSRVEWNGLCCAHRVCSL